MQKMIKAIGLVKHKNYTNSRVFIWIALIASILASCNEPNDLGMELLPSADLISVNTIEEKDGIQAFTVREDRIRTDEPSKNLLGELNDPVFGSTTVDFAAQFYLQTFPDFGTNTIADSINLYLYYRLIYGDTITQQRLKVYELNEPLYADTTALNGASYNYPYYQDVELKNMASSQLLGEKVFTPRMRLDSATQDTVYQLITIPLDISLGEKLINADSTKMVSHEAFAEYFKGLYLESANESGEGGTILTLETLAEGNFNGSALVVYYNNDENMSIEDPDERDTLYTPYVITSSSARVNSITHDYTSTPFYNSLSTSTAPDSLIYIQSTGGLESRISIEKLTSWKDSVNTGINRAELVFHVDTLVSDVENYPPPNQLLFIYTNDSSRLNLPDDYYFNSDYYGGVLDTTDYTYRFNITEHLQLISDDAIGNNGFYLTIPPGVKNSRANRVVLKGSESAIGIKLRVTYSKYSQ